MRKYIFIGLCVISILMLFLPFVTYSYEASMDLGGLASGAANSSQSISGIKAATDGVLGILLIIGPVLLIAMLYLKQLERFQKIFSIAVPAICLVILIFVYFQAKGFATAATGISGGSMVSFETKTSLGIGCILAAVSYIATGVVGAMIYHGITLDKAGLEQAKEKSTAFIGSAKEMVTQTAHNAASKMETLNQTKFEVTKSDDTENQTAESEKPTRFQPKKTFNSNRTEEVLVLIGKLSKMKDEGVLTEEEFTEKKKRLLEEI